MGVRGSVEILRITLRNPDSKALQDPEAGTLRLIITQPDGSKVTKTEGELVHDETGKFHYDYLTSESGEHHYRWAVEGATAAEGTFQVESEEDNLDESGPDLTDLYVLVPRARRKIEGPWDEPPFGKPRLADSSIYALVADAVSEVIMHSGSFFHHMLEVKDRDPLVGFPTRWKTDTEMTEWEAAVVTTQVALDYYFHVFKDMKTSESIQNEGTAWDYTLSANVIRSYLQSIIDERDKAIEGLRINIPVLDRYASNIRVRDQATVAVLEWWAGDYDTGTAGGLPGGQEASVVPVFYPPGP